MTEQIAEKQEGAEGEVIQEGVKEGEQVVEKEVEQAQPEPEAKDPNIYDEEGVPYKNRAEEFKRKYIKVLESKAEFKPEVKEELPELTPEEQAISDVVRKTRYIESKAVDVVDNVLDTLNSQFPGHFDNSDGELRKIILETSKNLDDKSKLNPATIQNIAFMAAKIKDVNKKESKPATKKLVSQRSSGSEVLNPSSKGGNSSDIQLSEEEQEYCEDHRLDGKGFSNEEIRDLYKASKPKK